MSDRLTDTEIEEKCARLRQLAAVSADFYQALIAERYPADKAPDLVAIWFDYELGWDE